MAVMTQTLYRVIVQHLDSAGYSYPHVERTETLYCGYDPLEMARVYYASEAEDRRCNGGSGRRTRRQKKNVYAGEV